MKQKLLSFLLAVLMSMVASVASAYDFAVNGIYYTITSSTDKTAAVVYRGWSYFGSVVIPKAVTYSGTTYSVTSIGSEAFRDCTSLTSVTIPNSVTSIGSEAFSGCI